MVFKNSLNNRLKTMQAHAACFCAVLSLAFHASATLIASFQAGDSSWHMGTIALGHLTGTPDLQVVVPYRDSTGAWYLDGFKYNGQRLPGFPYYGGGDVMNVSPTIYDLDHDGRDEIIFTRGNHIIALRGDGSTVWSNTVDSSNYVPTGGYMVITNGFYWTGTGQFISHLPSTAVFSSEVSSPLVMDFNGHGTNEIATAWKINPDSTGGGQDYNPFISQIYGSAEWGTVGEDWSGGVVFSDPRTGSQDFIYHTYHLLEAGLAVGHAKTGNELNVYAVNDANCMISFDKTQPYGFWGKGMLHKQFGKHSLLLTGWYQVPSDVYTADIDGDGLDEVLVSSSELSPYSPSETLLDDDGAVLWRKWLPTNAINHAYGWFNPSCMLPVNPDHDNHADVLTFNHSYEIAFRSWNGVELVDRPGWPKNFYPYLPTPPVVGDIDGDGQEEIIIATYNPTAVPSSGSIYVFALDGTLRQSLAVSGGVKQIPALADVEGTGRLDLIYRSIPGVVYIQNLGATGTNLVSWATHHGNMHREANAARSLYPPGTPLVRKKTSAFNRASFAWTNAISAQLYRIFRAEQPSGPFSQIATVAGTATSYTDYGLKPGWQYIYEVRAVYATNTVPSVPFAVLSMLNSNLIANGGFEENDNSHWDKWWSNIPLTNMVASTNIAYQGSRSMQMILQNQGNNDTIGQFNQYGIPDSTVYVTPGAFYSFGGFFKSGGISQQSQHWLQWSSTKTGYDTNNRPGLPYPNYFTPSFAAGTAPTDWGYVNRTFQMPAGFPNIELAHSYNIAAPGSGSLFIDNVFFRQIPAPNATNWTPLVPMGSTWKYFTNTAPANWFSPTFNDASWPIGTAKFGNGSGPTNIVTRVPQLCPAYYFRKQFVATNANIEELLLSATCTDIAPTGLLPLRVFLNGVEVKTPIETVTAQGNETLYFDLTPFASLIQAGTNTIGVIVSNYWSSWDDIAFDVSLKAVTYSPATPRLTLKFPTPGLPQVSVETPAGTIWQLQSSDSLTPAKWQTMQTVTNVAGATQIIQDLGQNNRLLPTATKNRFYRLVPY